ncbi:MAG: hypothetical protein JRD89_11840, partial [Deltaproteobacteria bacterium]|nr:hypothetical protein [Deltaproteobacteria bacterium]
MKKHSIVVGLLILICSLSLMFVSGCATDQTAKAKVIKSDASMNDILATETAKSKKEYIAMKKAMAAKKAAAAAKKAEEAREIK